MKSSSCLGSVVNRGGRLTNTHQRKLIEKQWKSNIYCFKKTLKMHTVTVRVVVTSLCSFVSQYKNKE